MTNKFEVYVVGGAPRNVLMGLPVNDIDYVVVGATPQDMLDLGYQQVGADFPVFLSPSGDEYALARTERKVGVGYHGFTVNADSQVKLEEDLGRRDLTVNAMAVSVEDWDDFVYQVSTGNGDGRAFLIDPFDGFAALQNMQARPCSIEAFVEDPLRLVRAARFSATYGFVWSQELNKAATQIIKSNELRTLSQERYFAEIEKVLKSAPTADQVREFSLRLIQFKLFDANFYFSYNTKGVIAEMAHKAFDADGHTSLGAKLNALCPQGVEDYYAKRFKFSNLLVDQIDFAHAILNAGAMMASADESMPIGSSNVLLLGVYESIRSGKAGLNMEFVADMAKDFKEVELVLKWLPTVEQIYKDVTFATVKMDPDTPKHMYSVMIMVARREALSAAMDKKNPA